MHTLVRRTVPVVGLASASALARLRRRWWASVIIDDLLGAPGGPTSAALAVNKTGVVVGAASGRGFCWNRGRTTWLTELGVGSRAASIDGAGVMAGACFLEDDDLHPMRWAPDGTTNPLPVPAAGWIGAATGLNGPITVGWCAHPGRPTFRTPTFRTPTFRTPWVWDADGGHALAVGGARAGEAAAVNGSGMVVGWTKEVDSTTANVWPNPTADPLSLPDLGGGHSRALACNDLGEIVGFATSPAGDDRACLWQRSGAPPQVLPTLAGAGARALGISGAGLIVGWSRNAGGFPHACVWEAQIASGGADAHGRRYAVHDLGTLGGQTSEAMGINDLGTVVGLASRGRGAVSMPIRPGGWSWEDRAFHTVLDAHRPNVPRQTMA